jgi:A/G-specific adenine glycosylase
MAQALQSKKDLQQIPGLGPYGRAIIGLATGRTIDKPPVDGNIARVMSRYYGFSFLRGEPRKKPEVIQAVGKMLSATSTSQKLASIYALVDIGDAVCKPRKPACGVCPFFDSCAAAGGMRPK